MATFQSVIPQFAATKRLLAESIRNINFQERCLSVSSKSTRRTVAGKPRTPISRPKWRSTADEIPKGDALGPYGLLKVDYSQPPPLLRFPPPPPIRKNPFRRYLAAFLAALATGIGVYVYLNPDEEMDEYWTQVERGNVPLTYGKGDLQDDEEDDDEEEES